MKRLHMIVSDKKATYQERDGAIVCGNNDYEIEVAFDSDWDSYTKKTARFIWNGRYVNVDFEGNICPVPIITNATSVEIGFYVVGTDMATTTAATIECRKSILCQSASEHNAPTVNGDSAFIRYSANADGTDFTETWSEGQNYIGFATGQSAPTDKSGYVWAMFTRAIPLILNIVPEFGVTYEQIKSTYEENKAFKQAYKNNPTEENEANIDSVYKVGYWNEEEQKYVNPYSIWFDNWSKKPSAGEVFVSVGKSNDGYVFSFQGRIVATMNQCPFAMDDLVLLHDASIDTKVAQLESKVASLVGGA